MKRLFISLVSMVFLGLSMTASATSVVKSTEMKQGRYATAAEARQNLSYFSDGTNMLFVNWGYAPVTVHINEFNMDVTLDGILDAPYNSFYLDSDYDYAYVTGSVYDYATHRYLFSFTQANPGTVEMTWDGYYIKGLTKTEPRKSVLTTKSGI